MPYATIEQDIRLYYTDEGNGKPLLFIHPPGMGSIVFQNQRVLASHFRVITYDMRGNGKSSPSNKTITIPLLAEDIDRLLDFLKIDRVIVCGYSNGGSIAQEFALRYPEHVEAIVLIGGFSEVCTPLLYLEFLLGIYTAKNGAISLLAKVLGAAHGKTRAEKKAIEQYVRLVNQNDLFHMYQAGLHYCCTERLANLNAPVLLIYGARDHYVHSYESIFKERLPHMRVVYIDKARHQIPTRHDDELNAILKAYFLS
ncbi:alpha/beta fold hydrolase [Anoxybacteroides tepidamans]|uniref:alpha/beta fold hydrolase n=1 Tax=Anoxybacteroides tepidamans TaxID=265948 RepID=UPI000552A903|nr:alpha/beta hydrolase [Anoxybacillus tepidamans]